MVYGARKVVSETLVKECCRFLVIDSSYLLFEGKREINCNWHDFCRVLNRTYAICKLIFREKAFLHGLLTIIDHIHYLVCSKVETSPK